MSFGEEELVSGPRGPRTRLGRLRLDLLVAAVILVGVIVVGRAMSRHNDGGAPKPTPTPSVSAPVGGFGTGAPDSGSGLLNGQSTFVARATEVRPGPAFPRLRTDITESGPSRWSYQSSSGGAAADVRLLDRG